jgi:TatD DNase family protein
MQLIDVHCHINDKDYGDVDQLIESVQEAGVAKIICAGFDIPSSEYGAKLSERYPSVYFTAGLHPTELTPYTVADVEQLQCLFTHPKCVAVGEIGLDYHYPDTDKQKQTLFFVRQMELAKEFGLPVQIHSRDAAEDTFTLVKQNAELLTNGAMLHCYSYSPELAVEFSKLGLYFSFGGTSTYPHSKKPQRCIAALPTNRLLTETDSPYLAPASIHGTFPNTPSSIGEVAQNMAKVVGLEVECLANTVWENAHRLYRKL